MSDQWSSDNHHLSVTSVNECGSGGDTLFSAPPPTVAVFFHWVAGIQCSYSPLRRPSKSRRMAGFHSFLSGLNVHLYNDGELSERPAEQCLRIELEGDSALWAQPFSSIREAEMRGCFSGIGIALGALPCLFPPVLRRQPSPILHLTSRHLKQDNSCCSSLWRFGFYSFVVLHL